MDIDPGRHGQLAIYRVFPIDGKAVVSVDLEGNASHLLTQARDQLQYDNGERGDFTLWRDAVSKAVGGDVVLLYADEDEEQFAFAARTVRVGTPERLICGTASGSGADIKVSIKIDTPISEVCDLSRAPSVRATHKRV